MIIIYYLCLSQLIDSPPNTPSQKNKKKDPNARKRNKMFPQKEEEKCEGKLAIYLYTRKNQSKKKGDMGDFSFGSPHPPPFQILTHHQHLSASPSVAQD